MKTPRLAPTLSLATILLAGCGGEGFSAGSPGTQSDASPDTGGGGAADSGAADVANTDGQADGADDVAQAESGPDAVDDVAQAESGPDAVDDVAQAESGPDAVDDVAQAESGPDAVDDVVTTDVEVEAGPLCPNGKVDPGEDCDTTVSVTCHGVDDKFYDGAGTLACSSACLFDTSACQWCGDGVINGAEECDKSAETMTCHELNSQFHASSGVLKCTGSCAYDTSACQWCGDGVKNGTEGCDGSSGLTSCHAINPKFYAGFGTVTCNANCTPNVSGCIYCGDGVKNGAEGCDGSIGSASCADQGLSGGVVVCKDCALDYTGCYSGVPQVTSMTYSGGGNSPNLNWPDGSWTTRAIFVGPDGRTIGTLSSPYTRSYSSLYPHMTVVVATGAPSTDYKLRVYRSASSAFELSSSPLTYAEYPCLAGGAMAAYCKAGSASVAMPNTGFTRTEVELLTTYAETSTAMTDNPFNPAYASKKHQFLFPATVFSAAGVPANASIVDVAFKVSEAPVAPGLPNFRLAFLATAKTGLSGFIEAPPLPAVAYGPTTVAASSFTVGAWIHFPLDTPVTWSGASNLVIETSLNSQTTSNGNDGGLFMRSVGSSGTEFLHEGGYYNGVGTYPFINITNNIHDGKLPSLRIAYQ